MYTLDQIIGLNRTPRGCTCYEGSGRKAYFMQPFVVKKPKNKNGKVKSYNECYIYDREKNGFLQNVLCPIFYSDDTKLIMHYATELMPQDKGKLTSLKQHVIPYLQEKYGLDEFDLECDFNWRKYNNHIVLID